MKLEYIVTENDINKNIKDLIISKFNISHRLYTTLKKENSIYLNNQNDFIYKQLEINDKISIFFDYEEDNTNIVPTKMNLNIVYEDEWILIVNKPAGIPVHPSILHYEDSLSNGIRYYFDEIGLKKKIRPVIRIDKDTSGLVVFAKCEYIQEALVKQMKKNMFKKEYIAIVEGILEDKKGVVDAPIDRKENSIIERCISKSGDRSITEYEVLKKNKEQNYSIIKCRLQTGRTHQIRVHMSYLSHPLLGDDLYGGNLNLINRQALHCYNLTFIHPITCNEIIVEADLPNDMLNLISTK